MTFAADAPLRLGVSSCLLGEPVRYDGGHKRDFFLVEALGRFVEWVPACPELESGLGVPRPSMRLTLAHGAIRLVTVKTAVDHTDTLGRYTVRKLEEIAEQHLSGFVLKKDSPSCGLDRVRVYNASGMPTKSGRGLFAAALVDRFPTFQNPYGTCSLVSSDFALSFPRTSSAVTEYRYASPDATCVSRNDGDLTNSLLTFSTCPPCS